MKIQFLFTLLFLIFLRSNLNAAEKDTLFLNQVLTDANSNLVLEKIIKFDSSTSAELMQRFENWGGQNFRNYESVKTSKTETQITLSYITSSFQVIDMYIILIAEFKDNKLRLKFFDDGNVFKPGSYQGGTTIPAIQGRTYKIKSYFENEMIIYKPNPGFFNIKEKQASGAIAYRESIEKKLLEIENYIKNHMSGNDKSDW